MTRAEAAPRPMAIEEPTGQQRGQGQTVVAEASCTIAEDEHDERARSARRSERGCRSERRDEEARDDGRVRDPAPGRTPEAMAKAIASGMATMPTMTPAGGPVE